jgi:hypothetical protein
LSKLSCDLIAQKSRVFNAALDELIIMKLQALYFCADVDFHKKLEDFMTRG